MTVFSRLARAKLRLASADRDPGLSRLGPRRGLSRPAHHRLELFLGDQLGILGSHGIEPRPPRLAATSRAARASSRSARP